MTDQERAVLKQALEALEATHYDVGSAEKQRLQAMDAITALRAALAQQEPALVGWSPEQCRQLLDTALAQEQQEQQEPVAWVDEASIAWLAEHPRGIITTRLVLQKSPERQMPLYTTPPRREWKGLKEWEINDGRDQLPTEDLCNWSFRQGVYFAEAKLKEKNNG
jgi:hypothetical protein